MGDDLELIREFQASWCSYKLNKAALRYEFGIHCDKSLIVWVNGPYRGAKSEVTIFREGLLQLLEEGETVLVDSGYNGEDVFVNARRSQTTQGYVYCNHPDDVILHFHRQKVENVIGRMKIFGVLTKKWRGTNEEHGAIVNAIAKINNLVFQDNPIRAERLFSQ
jgi:hypothetical protein